MTQAERRPRVTGQVIQAQDVFSGAQKPGAAMDELADVTAERALISAVLQEPDSFAYLSDVVQAGDMFLLSHAYIWYAFEQLFIRDTPIDIMSVTHILDAEAKAPLKGDQALETLAALYGAAPAAGNVEYYAHRVREAALRLRLVDFGDTVRKLAWDRKLDGGALTDKANELLFQATDQRAITGGSDAAVLAQAFGDDLFGRLNSDKRIGVATGWTKWDDPTRATGGLYPGTVTVVGGMSGFGKTTWVLSMIRNICKAGKRVVLFTLEMRATEEIMRVLVAMESGVSKINLRDARLRPEQVTAVKAALAEISGWRLDVIDDFRGADTPLTPLALRRRLRILTRHEAIDMLAIDGLWLMEDDDPKLRGAKERPRAVSRITDALSGYAKGGAWPAMPIVITHQYNREINAKAIKKPAMHHFAESAGVERNAQQIVALWRHEGSDYMEAYLIKDRANGNHSYMGTFAYQRDYARYDEV